MDIVALTSELMPEGKPIYTAVTRYEMIRNMVVTHGKKSMIKVLFLMIKDFCSSVNVVRNMNEEQMIEAAGMLLDECDNFRLQDYTMMFAMAKRGELVKIMDRIDLQMISSIMDEYWSRRNEAGIKAESEEIKHLDSLGSVIRNDQHPLDDKMERGLSGIAGQLAKMKEMIKPQD